MRHRPQRGDLSAGIKTFGPDFAAFPSDCWGRRDWELVEAKYQPLGETLPAPARVLLTGFRLFPGQLKVVVDADRRGSSRRASCVTP